MKKLTHNQLEYLLTFFKNEEYAGYRNIATSLIQDGSCVVAGNECIYKGYIGNFIEANKAENYIDCLEYKFNLKQFLSSAWFKESYQTELERLYKEKVKAENDYNELIELR